MHDNPAKTLLNSVKICYENKSKFLGKDFVSRGFYITDHSGQFYLHHDGKVKDGVHAMSEKPAFWPTQKEAQDFFDAWKAKQASISEKELSAILSNKELRDAVRRKVL